MAICCANCHHELMTKRDAFMLKLPPKNIVYDNSIELRLMSPRDGHSIFQGAMASLPELKRFMNWAHFDGNLAQSCAVYAEFEAKSLRGEELNFAGFDLHSGEFLFCCSLVPGSRLNPLAFEIGYWVVSSKTGKGLGTLAAKLLIVLAFREYQANRVSAVCNLENSRSLKVLENAGFRFEGCLRNYLMHPNPEIVEAGYSQVTDAKSFSLTPKDILSLAWFDTFSTKLSVAYYR